MSQTFLCKKKNNTNLTAFHVHEVFFLRTKVNGNLSKHNCDFSFSFLFCASMQEPIVSIDGNLLLKMFSKFGFKYQSLMQGHEDVHCIYF